MGVSITGINGLANRIERDVTALFRSAATEMHQAIVDRSNRANIGGSPVASGRYAKSNRVSLRVPDLSAEPEDPSYIYPSPSRHHYSRGNLPRATMLGPNKAYAKGALAPFVLGDTIYFNNSTPYAETIERGRRGRVGSWQKPAGVYHASLTKLFQDRGWR